MLAASKGEGDLLKTVGLFVVAFLAFGSPLLAQGTVAKTAPAAPDEKVVEGATPDRVAQIDRCGGRKFETTVEIDPVSKRSTKVKLCADPGASDAEWAKTLESSVVQIEQRDMPAAAKEKLIGELRAEIARVAQSRSVAEAAAATIAPANSGRSLIEPAERFETSTLPPLVGAKPVARKSAPAASASSAGAAPQTPMRIALKCFERGQTGNGAPCDYLTRNSILAISAAEGLERGGRLRFNRRGVVRREMNLAAMPAGKSVRIGLPVELCSGIASTKVEIELLGPAAGSAVAERLGPFSLRC